MLNKFSLNFFRLGFAAIFILEIFRWKVLKSSVVFTWQGLLLTVILVFAVLEIGIYFLEKKFGWKISWTSYAAAFLSLTLDAFGDMFGFYSRFSPWYDKVLHFTGGAVVAIIIYDILKNFHSFKPTSFSWGWMVVIIITTSLCMGFAYEWLEYAEDVFYWHAAKRLGDAYDTVDDMQLNLLGASMVGLYIYKFGKKPHSHPPLV